MYHLVKMLVISMLVMTGFSACQKAEEHTAEIAKESIAEFKEKTIDAAKAAATAAEQSAKATAEALADAEKSVLDANDTTAAQ